MLRVQDELWRALRVAPGLVERSDRVTRLGRHRGEVSVQVTHSLDDLEALPTEADRAKARGLAARNGIMVLGGMADQELDGIGRITPLTEQEAAMVRSWAAPPTWVTGTRHPGRGKYLIKSGERVGLPVALSLVETERRLYDTDQAWHSTTGRPAPAHTTRPGRRRGGCAVTGPSRAPLRLTEIAAPLVLLGILGGGTVVMTVTWVATCVAASLSAAGTVPDWGGATVAALAEATRLANLDPLIGAHGSRGLFWTAVGLQAAPAARRRRRGDLVVRAPAASSGPRRGRWPAAATCATWSGAERSAGRCSCGPPCRRPPRVAGPRDRDAARGWTRGIWGCGWVGSAATTCTPPRKTCSWRSPGRGRTRPPPWWCPRCCPRPGRW